MRTWVGLLAAGVAAFFGTHHIKEEPEETRHVHPVTPVSKEDIAKLLIQAKQVLDEFSKAKRQSNQAKTHMRHAQNTIRILESKEIQLHPIRSHEFYNSLRTNISQIQFLLKES